MMYQVFLHKNAQKNLEKFVDPERSALISVPSNSFLIPVIS